MHAPVVVVELVPVRAVLEGVAWSSMVSLAKVRLAAVFRRSLVVPTVGIRAEVLILMPGVGWQLLL